MLFVNFVVFECFSREPESLVKPEKLTVMTEKQRAETLEKLTPKATRHLILIRHGQYLLDADVKSLTALGLFICNSV
jgi:hypothetical protein